MDHVVAAWKGEERLWKVFWLYNFVLGTVIGSAIDHLRDFGIVVFIVVLALMLGWALWITVSLWRCAFNAHWRGWGYVVRGLVLMAVTAFAVSLFADPGSV